MQANQQANTMYQLTTTDGKTIKATNDGDGWIRFQTPYHIFYEPIDQPSIAADEDGILCLRGYHIQESDYQEMLRRIRAHYPLILNTINQDPDEPDHQPSLRFSRTDTGVTVEDLDDGSTTRYTRQQIKSLADELEQVTDDGFLQVQTVFVPDWGHTLSAQNMRVLLNWIRQSN